MKNPIVIAKEHPWLVGGAALIIVGGALLLFGRSSSDETGPLALQMTTTPDTASIQAGMQLQALKIASDAETAKTNAEREISIKALEVEATKALYQKDTAFHVADLTAQTAQKDIASKLQMSTLDYKKALDAQKKQYDLGVKTLQQQGKSMQLMGWLEKWKTAQSRDDSAWLSALEKQFNLQFK